VTPTAPNLAVGDQITLVASVSADASVTDRTVAWSTSNAAVASVDAATGVVKALTAGVATITATSNADKNQKGAAIVTVGAGSPVTVTISSIVSNATGNNVDLSNVAGQVDVTLNVDAGTNKLAGVDLIMNCTAGFPASGDIVVATQTISSSNVAVAEAAAAPVTLSFNTAQLDSATQTTPVFKNGQCQIKGRARLAGSTTQAASNTQTITLNNVDAVILKSFTTTPSAGQVATAQDATGAAWRAGAVNVTAVAVSYSGRSFSTATIALINGGTDNAINNTTTVAPNNAAAAISGVGLTSGAFTVSFPNAVTGTGAIGNAVVDTMVVAVSTLDSIGNQGPTLTVGTSAVAAAVAANRFIRLDNRAPDIATAVPSYNPNTQNTSAGWVGKAFVFSTGTTVASPINLNSAANETALGGIGKVVDTTLFATAGAATSAFASFSSVTSLAETSAAAGPGSYDLRLKVCDALGNCATTGNIGQFGVDLTAPTATVIAGSVANAAVYGIGATINTQLALGGSDVQGGGTATGSGFSGTPVLATVTRLAPSGSSSATTCVIGTPNTAGTACAAPAQEAFTTTYPATVPGLYTLVYSVADQAGNTTAPTTIQYYIDQAAPTASGALTMPASVTTGTPFSVSGADDMDVALANAFIRYTIAFNSQTSIRLVEPGTVSTVGQAFDNTLTRAVTASTQLSQFYRSLGTISGTTITAGVKPDSVAIRVVDAAGALSTGAGQAIPAANVTAAATAPFTIGTDLNGFALVASPATVSNGTGTGAQATTLTATVTAVSLTANTPFPTMCFYVVTPSGTEGGIANRVTQTATNELNLISCTGVLVTTDNAGVRTFTYTATFDPAAGYGTTGPLSVVAIGSNANLDAIAAQPAVITLAP
jgi:hypothetical protein